MSSTLSEQLVFQGKSLGQWLKQLDHPQAEERQKAVTAMLEVGSALTGLLPTLSESYATTDPATRAEAVGMLGEIGGQIITWLPMLRAKLKATVLTDRDDNVRTNSLQALIRLGPVSRSQVPALMDTLHDDLSYVRLNAAHALGQAGQEARDAVPALITVTLRDPDFRVRLEAAVSLWKIDKHVPPVVPVLIQALRHSDELVRWIAADCLGEIGPAAQEAIPALRAALEQPFKANLIRMSLELALQRISGT